MVSQPLTREGVQTLEPNVDIDLNQGSPSNVIRLLWS